MRLPEAVWIAASAGQSRVDRLRAVVKAIRKDPERAEDLIQLVTPQFTLGEVKEADAVDLILAARAACPQLAIVT